MTSAPGLCVATGAVFHRESLNETSRVCAAADAHLESVVVSFVRRL